MTERFIRHGDLLDRRHDRRRPDLSGRAVHSQHELGAESRPGGRPHAVRRGRRSRRAGGREMCRTTFRDRRMRTRKLTEFSAKYRLPAGGARGGAATTTRSIARQRPRRLAGRASARLAAEFRPPASRPSARFSRARSGKRHMLVGAGANIIVQIGDEGVLVIDTGRAARALDVLAAIRQVTDKPIRIVINTHVACRSHRRERGDRRGRPVARRKCARQLRARARERARPRARARPERMSAPSGEPSPRPFGAGRPKRSSARTRSSSSTTKRFS